MGAIWLPGGRGLFQVGCRSMFIHVKGWAVVRGSGWLKDSGGGRGCNKRNGYSRPARMPSPRDDQRGVFTQQRVARYNRENAHHHPSTLPTSLFFPLLSSASVPRAALFLFRRCPATRRYFHYFLPFYSDLKRTARRDRVLDAVFPWNEGVVSQSFLTTFQFWPISFFVSFVQPFTCGNLTHLF